MFDSDLKRVKEIEKRIVVLMFIGFAFVAVISFYLGATPLDFIGYMGIFGALSLLAYFLFLDLGDKKDKIFYTLLTAISTYALLGNSEINGLSIIYIVYALLLSATLIPYVTFRDAGIIGNEQLSPIKIMSIIGLVPIPVLGFFTIVLEDTSIFWLFMLIITIISIFLIVRNIKKSKNK